MRKLSTVLFCLLLVFLFAISACNKKGDKSTILEEDGFYIYFRDQSKYELYPVKGIIDLTLEDNTLISSIYSHMKSGADEADYTSPIAEKVTLNAFSLQESRLILNFSSEYDGLSPEEEVIMRAALVRTFTQLSNVQTVEIRVDGQPLVLKDGTIVGQQHYYDFVDILGSGLNDYTQMTLKLYFADQNGDHLVPFTTDVTFSDSYTTEQYILFRLINGPQNEEQGYPSIPSEVKVNSVTVKDGICHVNLSADFKEETLNVSPEVMIYSIVNSLTEIKNISGVRILINGSSNIKLYDKVDLNQTFMRNLDIIAGATDEK